MAGLARRRPARIGPQGAAPLLKVLVVIYGVAILGFVWLTKDLTFATLTEDPIFAGYSITVVIYVLGRFVGALFYRPVPDGGYRPTVSVIIPAFNEEDGIMGTIESCLRVDYPGDLIEVIVVNDGSTDRTWERILEAKARWPEVYAVDLGRNYGKRGAMAEGIRRAGGEILCFVDSDSYLKPGAVVAIVQPFADQRVGTVVGHAYVRNAMTNWITKMQQVRYYSAFRVIKSMESLLSGTVTCASGCCAAYRTSVILPILDAWECQTFLGRPATFGDDRALTNRVLTTHRVVYQSTAQADTVAPDNLRVFFRQQLRWKKSWLRESLWVVRLFWRKNPLAALFTYASIVFPFMAPFVVIHAVGGRLVGGSWAGLWFYLIGTYAMALLYSLYYAFKRHDGLWHHGLTFVVLYMGVLVFQTYWGILTMRDTRWGTRASTVDHNTIDQMLVTALPAEEVDLPLDARESRYEGVRPFRTRPAPPDRGRPGRPALVRRAVRRLRHLHVRRAADPRPPPGGHLPAGAARTDRRPGAGGAGPRPPLLGQGHGPRLPRPRLRVRRRREGRLRHLPERFGEHLATLRAAGMNTVTASDVARALGTGKPLPPNAVMISFDDGRIDALLWADPCSSRPTCRRPCSSSAAPPPARHLLRQLEAPPGRGAVGTLGHPGPHPRLPPGAQGLGRREAPKLTSLNPDESIGEYRERVRDDLEENNAAISSMSAAARWPSPTPSGPMEPTGSTIRASGRPPPRGGQPLRPRLPPGRAGQRPAGRPHRRIGWVSAASRWATGAARSCSGGSSGQSRLPVAGATPTKDPRFPRLWSRICRRSPSCLSSARTRRRSRPSRSSRSRR